MKLLAPLWPPMWLLLVLIVAPATALADITHPCSPDALKRAPKLLALHSNSDDRASISDKVTVLPSLRNPANAKQTLDVIGVTGHIYKGEYRMRFIYGRVAGECVLIGQEILEFTRF